jgi:hypothetical protein
MCIVVLAISACGGGESSTQTPNVDRATRVVQRALQGIPRYPQSVLSQPSVGKDGEVYVATYIAPHTTPEAVLEFFATRLPNAGWVAVAAPTASADSVRSRWERGTSSLLISAAPAPTARGTVQYSVTLHRQATSDAPPPPA